MSSTPMPYLKWLKITGNSFSRGLIGLKVPFLLQRFFEFIQGARKQFGERRGVYWLVFYNEKLVGQVFLLFIDWDDKSAEIGYWLDRAVTGKGIITKACDALLQFAFEEWNLHRISLNTDAENIPSQAVADRLGFVYEGTKRESNFINQQYRNMKQYSLLKHEYKPLQE